MGIVEPDGEQRLFRVASDAQRTLHKAAADLDRSTTARLKDLEDQGPEGWMRTHMQALEAEREATGTLYMGFDGDSLVCWTGQPSTRPKDLLSDPARHLILPDALYLHSIRQQGSLTLHGLRPIWRTPPIENAYLQRSFHPALGIPQGIMAGPVTGTGPAIKDDRGAALFELGWQEGAMEFGPWIMQRLLLLLLTMAFAVTAIWSACQRIAKTGRTVVAATLFMVLTIGLRGVMLLAVPPSPFDRLPLFDPAVYATSMAFPSLGDLILNALLLLVMALFGRRMADRGAVPMGSAVLAWSAWAGLLLFGAWITQLIIGVVDNSSVDLDLFHVQGMSLLSAAALLGIALLYGAWWITASVTARTFSGPLRPSSWWPPLLIALVGSVILHHLLGVVDTILFLWPMPLLALLVLRRGNGLRFVQAVLAIGVLAGTTAHILTKYTRVREDRERPVLAERLAIREDPVVELLFRETAPGLRSDPITHRLLTGSAPCDATQLDQQVRQRFFTGYWERYDVRLFAIGADGQLRCATDNIAPQSFSGKVDDFNDPMALADMPDLFIEEQPGRSPFYHARIAVMLNDSTPPGQIILELHPRSASQGPGFPDLLLAGDDPLARRAERYSVARYEGGLLAERTGRVDHPLRWQRPIPASGLLWYTDRQTRFLAKGDPAGTLIVLGSTEPSLVDHATTFSYLFALFGTLAILALGLRTAFRGRSPLDLGISAKVRLALLLFAVIGLSFFGVGTQRLLAEQYEQRFHAAILQKARSVGQELHQRFAGEPPLNSSHVPYLEHLLARSSNVFFTDITVYSAQGRMLASSRPQIFSNGLLGRRMDPMAYVQLALNNSSGYVHQEAIGSASYRTAYVPLHDRGGRTLAYIALPSFADRAQQEEERGGVLIAVVNLFVLLFALSVLVAVFISNWTTRPLDLLKNALSRVALQGANEPIRYRGNDEVGQLVEVYNRKVEELHASAERLARSERESAWREMARQVAHEIKNPLTPMKLGIQHFQRTWSPDAPDAAERLERFSQAMVEQIDALSNIAGEFSNFAQMPRTQEEDLDLADVVDAALALIGAVDKHFTLERPPGEALPIRADREQLLRVFNNLLKNAEQSIPEGRVPNITVVLRRTDEQVIAEVRDNGSGIAGADQERIFRPNFTTKSSGMGLGLAMVQRIVEGAGGKVWFETREGQGTTFFVALPLGKA
jgi:signal transduction histidine kinase